MKHVFISYVRDDAPQVRRLARDLNTYGIDVWLDKERIKPGERWQDVIAHAIEGGNYFIACFSSSYVARDKSYMNEELALAIEQLRQYGAQRIWFIPVLLSECDVPDQRIRPGETLRSLQWVDLYRDWSAGIKQIASVIAPQAAEIRNLQEFFPQLYENEWSSLLRTLEREGPEPVYLIIREEFSDRQPHPTDISLDAPFTLRTWALTGRTDSSLTVETIDVDAKALNHHLDQILTSKLTFDKLEAFGKKLASLVLPSGVASAIADAAHRPLVVVHDTRSARVPWEMLCLNGGFPPLDSGLTRKFITQEFPLSKRFDERRKRHEFSVLLIVNPTVDLAGAEEEGDTVKKVLAKDTSVALTTLYRGDADWNTVRSAFTSPEYDAVHFAGHGFSDPFNPPRSGIVCSQEEVLSVHRRRYCQVMTSHSWTTCRPCFSSTLAGQHVYARVERDLRVGTSQSA